ncbi:MAG: glycosyl transferase family 2 [Sulfurovum sp. PC08-66]|nr:MAG: glycosyl transferase family 2 [Sulfurovum sp. PC08-66]KIM12471.1 MAG: glycosyl transferase family 2 [Sulfuricurvum sp. PC08-66]
MNKYDIFASIVLYHNSEEQIKRVISSFFSTQLNVKLFLIDNSKEDSLKKLALTDDRIEYIFNNANIGYGAGHNIAMRKSIAMNVPCHVVLNPDIYFGSNVLDEIFYFMNRDTHIGNVMPRVLYPNGTNQQLCKLLPTPVNWFGRFVLNYIKIGFLQKMDDFFMMKFADMNEILEVPYLSGCFMFLRVETLKQVNIFDENIFLHTEDTDLSRRIFRVAKNIYYPKVEIYHEHNREAYRSFKVMLMQIKSMIYYFNKWGWFFDRERKEINQKTIEKYSKRSV